MKQTVTLRRIENLSILIMLLFLYFKLEYSHIQFALLLFAPDVFMVGYIKNTVIGAHIYNIGHSYLLPCLIVIVGTLTDNTSLQAAAIIWATHIALDRSLGYGLKYQSGFTDTDLGHIGKKK